MAQSDIRPGRLAVLDDHECWDLLRSQPVGRIAWSGAQGVSVVPVNFVVADDSIVLRTTPYSLLARESTDRDVAFEVDHFDAEDHSGWSVLVRGRCVRVHRASERSDPWATGARVLDLQIEVRTVSGRRVIPSAGEGGPVGQSDGLFFTA
ncbi:MAG TPA: pyridoxamine 5'-phosphate oxidase family protein [Nocardioides sp.]|nr:pyridoxamine 5'-phosphate oxidase family protein [Nocardioides sp.]